MSAVRTTTRLAVALLAAAALLIVVAPTAGAQEDGDPYGNTTTTTDGGTDGGIDEVTATCTLTLREGRPGDTVTATVDGVFFGESVRILFDGVQVGSTTAPVAAEAVGGAVAFNGVALPAQAETTSVRVTFTVPKAAVGTHVVTAVGDTFTCFCNPDGLFRVLAAAKSKSSLPRTGIYLALFLAIAGALLVAGRALIGASRRRRAHALAIIEADRATVRSDV
ncbi:MAG: LPXTG cell wall anchor domain-containing protein [Acidimicrobiales bacterium]|nr:LPXTG cell wall anchor domain-containing protein [Acidimicrobiales bacterium]